MARAVETARELRRVAWQMPEFGVFLLCREILDGGLTEYRIEDFKGKTLVSKLNPKDNFYVWAHREVGKQVKATIEVNA